MGTILRSNDSATLPVTRERAVGRQKLRLRLRSIVSIDVSCRGWVPGSKQRLLLKREQRDGLSQKGDGMRDEEPEARAVNAAPLEPLPGMVKLRCTTCGYWLAAPAADVENCPDCAIKLLRWVQVEATLSRRIAVEWETGSVGCLLLD